MLHRDVAYLPIKFRCYACGLDLDGHASLHAAGLGGRYAVTQSYDPIEHYGEVYLQSLAEDMEAFYQNE